MEGIPILGGDKMLSKELIDKVGTALFVAQQHLAATDAANAAANLADVRPRPLTVMVSEALDALREATA